MFSVGEVLKQARLEQALDLETVAARTKINIRCLTAIEADDRTSLPSGFFYRSFVDQYARLLSLDTREINAEVDRLLSLDAPLPLPGYENQVARDVPPIMPARRFRWGRAGTSLAALVAVVVGCSGIYAWWHKTKIGGATSVATKGSPALPAGAAVPLASIEKKPPATAPGSKVLLDLMAHEETWLSVTSDGKRLFSGILAPNQTKTVAGRDSATLKVGNAAALEVRLNGKLLAPLGGRGQVLMVVFTPNDYQIVPTPPREGD
jgi:cytoskeleton protein RodZ